MSNHSTQKTEKPYVAKLAQLPQAPGVYIMKDARSAVIYVGKAKNLRSRVRSYFQDSSSDERLHFPMIVDSVHDIDSVVTANEQEALILESNLIQQFKPRYNINLKDDKSFISLRLDLAKPFPRLEIVRMHKGDDSLYFTSKERSRNEVFRVRKRDKAIYFGPYSSASSVRETVRFINRIFPIRKCPDRSFLSRTRPCLYNSINQCLGPCCGNVDEEAYREILEEVIMFLRGQKSELIEELESKMKAASALMDYERAAGFRDEIEAIRKTVEKQNIIVTKFIDRDVFGFFREGDEVQVQGMFVRGGRLSDLTSYRLKALGLPQNEFVSSFIKQFYVRDSFVPKEVVVPVESEDWPVLAEVLSERKGEKVSIIVPQRGERMSLQEMANRNAENAFRAEKATVDQSKEFLASVQAELGLKQVPFRVECFDISNIAGKQAVGSMVTFENGLPNKKRYRRYRIRDVKQVDDFGMMREVLLRRYSRAAKEKDFPDLTIVDGGKGQLGVATEVLLQLGKSDHDVIGLAKARRKTSGGSKTKEVIDRVFVPDSSDPIQLPEESPVLRFLGRVRDEAHRFAVAYHTKLRRQSFLPKPLEGIPGLGKGRRKLLIQHFKNIGNLREASIDEIAGVKGISRKLAEAVCDHLHPEKTT